jgi:hypothetical protein
MVGLHLSHKETKNNSNDNDYKNILSVALFYKKKSLMMMVIVRESLNVDAP